MRGKLQNVVCLAFILLIVYYFANVGYWERRPPAVGR